jgi:hypothetical protein
MCSEVILDDACFCLNSSSVGSFIAAGPLAKLNGALLTLILKSEVTKLPGDFRPISLIHSFTKLLSKVLARRLTTLVLSLMRRALSSIDGASMTITCMSGIYQGHTIEKNTCSTLEASHIKGFRLAILGIFDRSTAA